MARPHATHVVWWRRLLCRCGWHYWLKTYIQMPWEAQRRYCYYCPKETEFRPIQGWG